MPTLHILPVDTARLEALCEAWKVKRLELFGSARFDYRAAHDVDLLVSFAPDAEWSLFDHARLELELSQLLGKKVDLVTRRSIEASPNVLRKRSILDSATDLYVAG